MEWRDLITVLFWLGCITLLWGLLRRKQLWLAGRAQPQSLADTGRGLMAIPKRYFVDLHHVVSREPSVAHAHVALAGGAVLLFLLIALNEGLRLRLALLDSLIVFAAGLMLLGAVAMAARRWSPPSRLSRGPWRSLPYILGLAALGVLVFFASLVAGSSLGPLLSGLTVLALALGCAELALGISCNGPMKHAVTGLLHLAFHPRPERFGTQEVGPGKVRASVALLPLQAEPPAHSRDFAWNRLLSFDACVQCGKCEAACPAFAAGQPLNPKKLIQDMVVGFGGARPSDYHGSPYPSVPAVPDSDPLASWSSDTLWSCTTCRACVHACPMLIEHVDTIVSLRRHETLVKGEVPNKGEAVLRSLRETDTQGRNRLASRYHWAVDLELPTLGEGEACDWLLLAGESAYELRNQRTLRLLVKTLKHAGIAPAILGAAETDCGDVARRLGDEVLFQHLAKQLIATLQARRISRIVTTDPHILHTLRNEYPALGGHFEVWHHSELLADLLATGALKPDTSLPGSSLPNSVTFHDPCYLARYNGQTAAPRHSLKGIGIEVVEMERHGENARCCGGGGGAPYTDIQGSRRIPDIRMDDARSTGASTLAVACPQCMSMLEGVVGNRPDVMDVAELVAAAIGVKA